VLYSFEDDADLCFIDFHQDDATLYPGTDFINETGKGKAVGTKLDIPLPPNSNDKMAKAFWKNAEDFIKKFKPEFILLQCGADSLTGDDTDPENEHMKVIHLLTYIRHTLRHVQRGVICKCHCWPKQ